jgi:peptide/nickel transport system permease protein
MSSIPGLIVRRLLIAIPTLLIVATLTFFLMKAVPGSPAAAVLGTNATPQQYERIEDQLGLNRPVLDQYGSYMGDLLTGDLGRSYVSNQPVSKLVSDRLPVTLSLAAVATLLSLVVGVLVGTFAAIRGGIVDRIVTTGSGLGLALPSFWVAVLLALVFSIKLGWFPATDYIRFGDSPWEWLRHIVLPVLALAFVQVATIARQTRSEMIRVLDQDFIRTLRANGLSRRSVIWKHGLRNAAVPVVTVMGLQFVAVFGGAIIIERVFALPGVGTLTLNSATTNDLPIVQGVVVTTAAMVLVVNLLIDVLYWMLQPQARRAPR